MASSVEGSDKGLQEGAMLKLGLLECEDNEKGWANALDDTDPEL